MDYWREAFCAALDEAGMVYPAEQQLLLAVKVLEGAHENYGMAFGHDCIPNPIEEENKRLIKALEKERNKSVCPECIGSGQNVVELPIHTSISRCWNCNGEGKV
jgi:hypothetical protein